MKQKIDYDTPIIRRRELLALTSLERGIVAGWEERGLWHYSGPEGKHRLYTLRDTLSMALVAELCSAGITPRHAWDTVNDMIKYVIGGQIKYTVIEQGADGTFAHHGVRNFDQLRGIIEPASREDPTPRVAIIVAVGEIRRQLGESIDRFFVENLPDSEVQRRMALNDQEDAL